MSCRFQVLRHFCGKMTSCAMGLIWGDVGPVVEKPGRLQSMGSLRVGHS